jgi:OmpA-OmpF porin, OOP family
MSSIIGDLMRQVATPDNLSTITKSVGGNQNGVQSALSMGLPLLMSSMANSASTPGGADMLTKMVGQLGGSNPVDNIGGYLSNPQAAGGSGMLNTLLGSQMGPIQNAISQKTGLPPAVVGKVLAIAVPMVVGHVGKMLAKQKMDQKGLSSLLGEQSKMAMQSSPEAANMAKQVLAQPKVSWLKKLLGS